MAGALEIKYGEGVLLLRKSKRTTAIKRTFSASTKSIDQLETFSSRTRVKPLDSLGGYEMIDIDSSKKNLKTEKEYLGKSPEIAHQSDVYHTSDDRVPFVPTGTIYLEFVDGTAKIAKEELLGNLGLTIVEREPDGTFTVAISNYSNDAIDVCLRLQSNSAILLAEPDLATYGELKNTFLPDDTWFSRQWHLQNDGEIDGDQTGLKSGADARVPDAWQLLQGYGARDVIIGIIDDGFDLSHPDLAERSIHPWDFQRNSSDVSPVADRSSPTTGDWHGTPVAGVAVGAVGQGQIAGVAPGCSWMPVRWVPKLEPIQVANWFKYLEQNGAWVVNCSWSALARNYPLSARLTKAIGNCVRSARNEKGCTVVFAAGNENRDINNPVRESVNGFAIHPDVITVAASTSLDERAEYSNFGSEVNLCAPSSGAGGRGISTADVTGTFTDIINMTRPMGYVDGDYTQFFGRTSSACPVVAGVCGLMLSANPHLRPAEVREILSTSARRIGGEVYDDNGHSTMFGSGCVNAKAAVARALERLPIT